MAATVREVEVFPICIREVEVLRVEDVTPGMRRVIVGGSAMDSHVRDGVRLPAVCTNGFDDDVKLLPVDPQTGALPFDTPRNTDTGAVDWPAGSFQYSRTYTVRSYDADTREMAIDFAEHEGGLASDWAYRVRPGETILMAGPKHSASLPREAEWMLVAGDQTALPAIARCLEMLPADMPATVVIEVAEPSHRQELKSEAPVEITWLFRSENGGKSRLVETVQAARWRPGQPYLWVAGEALTIKPLRRWAKQDRAIPKQFVEITGYWRQREVPRTEGTSGEGEATPDAYSELHEMSELLPPCVIRTAVTVGVFAAIEGGAATPARIAAVCETHPDATAKLLRHLVAMNLLTVDGDRFGLTEMGEILAAPDTFASQALHFGRFTPGSTWRSWDCSRPCGPVRPPPGTDSPTRHGTGFVEDFHEEAAAGAVYRAPALPYAVDLDGVRTVAIYGEGAGVYADTLARVRPDLDIALVDCPRQTTEHRGRGAVPACSDPGASTERVHAARRRRRPGCCGGRRRRSPRSGRADADRRAGRLGPPRGARDGYWIPRRTTTTRPRAICCGCASTGPAGAPRPRSGLW